MKHRAELTIRIVVLLIVALSSNGCVQPLYVYDRDGRVFSAPEICEALAKCQKDGKLPCYVPRSGDFQVVCK